MPHFRLRIHSRKNGLANFQLVGVGSEICQIASHISWTSPDVLSTKSRMRSKSARGSLRRPDPSFTEKVV